MRPKSSVGALFSKGAISPQVNLSKSYDNLLKCGVVKMGEVIKYCECKTERLYTKYRCNLRVCPICSKTRQRRLRRRYLNDFKALPNTRKYFLYFLTISPENYKNLDYGIKHIRKSFQNFLRLAYRKGNRKYKRKTEYVKDRVKGGLYVIEYKKRNNEWNIHIHALVYGKYLDNRIRGNCKDCGQNLLKKDYYDMKFYCANKKCNSKNVKVYKDSRLNRLFHETSGLECNTHITRLDSALHYLNYLLKYITLDKNTLSSDELIREVINATWKKQLITPFGLFYNFEWIKVKTAQYICKCCKTPIYFFNYGLIRYFGKIPPPI